MKRIGFLGLLVVFYMFLVGMGGLGGTPSVNVPEPTTSYAATVTDQSDIATRLDMFSFDGETSVSGKLGNARISISFDKIGSIGFALQDKTLTAGIRLMDGKIISVVVNKGTACYGKLAYGDFKIDVEDIKSIILHGEVSQ